MPANCQYEMIKLSIARDFAKHYIADNIHDQVINLPKFCQSLNASDQCIENLTHLIVHDITLIKGAWQSNFYALSELPRDS